MTTPHNIEPDQVARHLRRARNTSAVVGLCGIAACIAGWIIVLTMERRWPQGAASFYKAYLFAWLFCLGVSLGAMSAVMMDHLIGSEWGLLVRRFGEAAAGVLPLLFILFIPILIGLHHIYPWADPHRHQPILGRERAWMNLPAFVARYVIYFLVWIFLAWSLRRLSIQHDRTGSLQTQRWLRIVSAPGLVLYVVLMSLASVDWIMSLDPQWYSTVFGFVVCLGQCISGTAILIIMVQLLSGSEPFASRVRPRHFNDLATLLITVVILWAYNAFAQLLVIWMGNIQGEIPWYVRRTHGAWRGIAALLIFLGFLAPFLLLLQRGVKQRGRAMLWICFGLLFMRLLDIYWMVAPSGDEPYPGFHWFNGLMSVVALIGIGGLWVAAFLWLLEGPPLMPRWSTVPLETPPPHSNGEPRSEEHGAPSAAKPGIA